MESQIHHRQQRRARERHPILGPVFWYDLIRTSRRGHLIGHRMLYAGVLTVILVLIYWNYFPYLAINALIHGYRLSLAEQGRFASITFNSFMAFQFVVIFFLTPLYTADAIAKEKERRTLDLFFTTELSDREIVLGTLASRAAHLILILITALPILGFLIFLGGVEPEMLLAACIGSLVLTLSVGSISMVASIACRTVAGALAAIYAIVALLAIATGLLLPLVELIVTLNATPLPSPPPGQPPPPAAWDPLTVHLWFIVCLVGHLILAFVCCTSAIISLRRYAMLGSPFVRGADQFVRLTSDRWPSDSGTEPHPGWGPYDKELDPVSRNSDPHPETRVPPSRWPPVGDDVLLWKELHLEPRYGPAGVTATLAYFCLGFVLSSLLAFKVLSSNLQIWGYSSIGILGTWCIFGLCVLVALNAANRMTRERQRRTLDTLLMLPYSHAQILFSKWLASILSVRGLFAILLGLWAMGLVTGGLHIVALPLLIATVIVYLAFFASVGLWFSTVCKTPLRANLYTIAVVLAVLFGSTQKNTISYLTLSSANVAREIQFSRELEFSLSYFYRFICVEIVGLHVYMAAALLVWLLTLMRFRAIKGPKPLGRGTSQRSLE
jgi:ABC-type transport system involved in multi-copper enzyme maturation permease subunit